MSGRLFGDRKFYENVMRVAVPIMIQQGITNFVGMLDNIMVGRLGTDPMSGVAIVNELIFIFNLCIFGGLSGIGIFTAQFYGKGDTEGVRDTFRMNIWLIFFVTVLGIAVLLWKGDALIMLFLHQDGGGGSVAETLHQAQRYLAVMYAGLLPFGLAQMYSTTLRNTGETVIPMKAGILAVMVNLIGNYVLIYGKFGAPALGVAGAAAATVISRFVELAFVAGWTHFHPEINPFAVGAWSRMWQVPSGLARRVVGKAIPLMANETLWAAGMATLMQCYSVRGLSAVAALNISQTITNVFNISFIAMGNAIAILLGQTLGAGKIRQAREDATKLSVFSVLICVGVGAVLFLVSPMFPRIYNTSDSIRELAAGLIRISAAYMPLYAYINAVYFVLRSGGKTLITFLFDSFFYWIASNPLAFVLAYFTDLPVLTMYLLVQSVDFIKCVLGFVMVRRGSWAVDLTA